MLAFQKKQKQKTEQKKQQKTRSPITRNQSKSTKFVDPFGSSKINENQNNSNNLSGPQRVQIIRDYYYMTIYSKHFWR